MQEQSKREELLSEELLEWVTGARSDPSFYKCPDCQEASAEHRGLTALANELQSDAHAAAAQGDPMTAATLLGFSDAHHQLAREAYARMIASNRAHNHPNPPWSPPQD